MMTTHELNLSQRKEESDVNATDTNRRPPPLKCRPSLQTSRSIIRGQSEKLKTIKFPSDIYGIIYYII